MKRCPECRRDYTDETLNFCLDDGSALVEGPASTEEPATAVFAPLETTSEAPTRYSSPSDVASTSGGSPEGVALRPLRWIFVSFGLVIFVGAIGYFGYRYVSSSSGSVNSIAVLPFANTGGDKDTEFLSDGIAETLINNFTKIPELKVTARTTAFRFRGREGEPKEIGRELGVGSVLTGTVLRQNDTVRIQVDLIDTTDGSQMWGHRYDGKIDEIVNIQQKIATDVASRLRLTTAQTQQISKTYTQNAEAYQHYLRGRYHWNLRTGEDLRHALAEFEQAANKDPNYALAYVGISDCYALLDEYGGGVSSETLPKAKSYAEKARALDNDLAEAYASLGLIYFKLWQWNESESAFTRAIELNPNYPTTYHWYSIMLRYRGRFDTAHDMIKKAAGLDPLSLIIKSNLAISYRNRGELEAALTECRGMQALDPNFIYVNECFGSVYLELGRFDEAVAEYRKYSVSRVKRSSATADLASALARAGRRQEALVEVKSLTEMFDQGRANAVDVAQVYSALEENDKAFEWIEIALSRREGSLPGIAGDHFFRFIRKDPRMETVLKRMGLG